MKQFISNGIDLYLKVTNESNTHFICNNIMFDKKDVVINYYPLDNMNNILHLHVVPFYN